jgi:hypothetical protein
MLRKQFPSSGERTSTTAPGTFMSSTIASNFGCIARQYPGARPSAAEALVTPVAACFLCRPYPHPKNLLTGPAMPDRRGTGSD